MEKSCAKPRRWTRGSIECYNIGCNCSKCDIVPADLTVSCKMKYAVRELVRKYGKPQEDI